MSGPERRSLVSIGNYRLTGNTLGKGHFARVEEAVHTLLNVKVAIKIFDLLKMNDKYMEQHLRREAVILARLSHPCIIALFEVQETDTNYFLIEELGAGGNLSSFAKNRRLDDRRARSFCQQLSSALAHMHGRGVIHRDLKMDNILLDKQKEIVKIADFGLSNQYTPNCFLNTHCGSPEYAAPELFVYNKKYGPEIDIWSLGVVFYAMVVGKLPFQTPKRANETHDENRNRLVAELKHGLAAKQIGELIKCNTFFKFIISKMLVPAPRDRISVHQLRAYCCTANRSSATTNGTTTGIALTGRFDDFPPFDEPAWQPVAVHRISHELNIPSDEVHTGLAKHPLGAIGGVYNIRRHQYQVAALDYQHMTGRRLVSGSGSGGGTAIAAKTTPRPKHVNFKTAVSDVPVVLPITLPADSASQMRTTKSQPVPARPATTPKRSAMRPTRSAVVGQPKTAALSQRAASPYAIRRRQSSARPILEVAGAERQRPTTSLAKNRPTTGSRAISPQSPHTAGPAPARRPVSISHRSPVATPYHQHPEAPDQQQRITTPRIWRPTGVVRPSTAAGGGQAALHELRRNQRVGGRAGVAAAALAMAGELMLRPSTGVTAMRTAHELAAAAETLSPGAVGTEKPPALALGLGSPLGVPMHTAQRAAARKAARAATAAAVVAAAAAASERSVSNSNKPKPKLGARVLHTIDSVSRSFSKFVATTARRRTATAAATATATNPRSAKSANIATDQTRPTSSAKKASGLLFWRRPPKVIV